MLAEEQQQLRYSNYVTAAMKNSQTTKETPKPLIRMLIVDQRLLTFESEFYDFDCKPAGTKGVIISRHLT